MICSQLISKLPQVWIAHVEINVFSQTSKCPVVLWQSENGEVHLCLGPH